MMNKLESVTRSAPLATLDERSIYLRRLVVDAVGMAGRGHVGGALSIIEILRVLYDKIMRFRVDDPTWDERDRFILSKGHGCLALYAILADKGFFPKKELDRCFKKGSPLGGHPEIGRVPGIEVTTGALGHGLPMAVGMALAARLKKKNYRLFVVLGDGEIQEGSVWEAAMCAAKHGLSNLTAIIDYNKVQSAGPTKEILDLEPLAAKWTSFGFTTVEVDGHDVNALEKVFGQLPLSERAPSAVICHTVKGKGIPFAENDAKWHYQRVDAETVARMHEVLGDGHA